MSKIVTVIKDIVVVLTGAAIIVALVTIVIKSVTNDVVRVNCDDMPDRISVTATGPDGETKLYATGLFKRNETHTVELPGLTVTITREDGKL